MIRTVYNGLLGGWFNVRGPHQSPIGGRYPTRDAAKAALAQRNPNRPWGARPAGDLSALVGARDPQS